jgi:hypothetical protein
MIAATLDAAHLGSEKRSGRCAVNEQRSQRFKVRVAGGIAAMAVGVPFAGGGFAGGPNCAGGYCFVPVAGTAPGPIITDGPIDGLLA